MQDGPGELKNMVTNGLYTYHHPPMGRLLYVPASPEGP